MKSPFTGGNVIKKSKQETFTFRNEKYNVKRSYFLCEDTGKTFSTAEVDDKLMEDVYSLYRERHAIPSPVKLKELRDKYGLSAHIMSKIAGIGINQYGLYEKGEMPTVVVGHRLAALFDRESFLKSIDASSLRLGKDYRKVREKVETYAEPHFFNLRKDRYAQFSELIPVNNTSLVYQCKKSRWGKY